VKKRELPGLLSIDRKPLTPDKDLLQQLASILDVAKKDEAVKAVIITGAGERPSRLERTLGFSTMPRLLRFGN